ncbi:MAG: hypothetical protein ACRCW1_04405 [Anaerotignaceae bacterium]
MALGEKRGNSIFEKSTPIEETPSINLLCGEELIKEDNKEDDNKEEFQFKELARSVELGVKKTTHSLFFAPNNEGSDFSSVLKEVQGHISANYSQLITDTTLEDAKEQIKRYISKFVMEKRIAVLGMNGEELISALYTEMAEYGFLTKYIFGKGIEEIDSATRS